MPAFTIRPNAASGMPNAQTTIETRASPAVRGTHQGSPRQAPTPATTNPIASASQTMPDQPDAGLVHRHGAAERGGPVREPVDLRDPPRDHEADEVDEPMGRQDDGAEPPDHW